jgi:hypothetical protein
MYLISELLHVLNEIYTRKSDDFSGVGIVLYRDLSNLPIIDLKVVDPRIGLPLITRCNIVDILVAASDGFSRYHDGFHLLNEKFELTHLSQYLSPPIDRSAIIRSEFGSRYRTAIYTSLVPGIIACGVVSSSYAPTVLVQGHEV